MLVLDVHKAASQPASVCPVCVSDEKVDWLRLQTMFE
jgi:hypothetical protein